VKGYEISSEKTQERVVILIPTPLEKNLLDANADVIIEGAIVQGKTNKRMDPSEKKCSGRINESRLGGFKYGVV